MELIIVLVLTLFTCVVSEQYIVSTNFGKIRGSSDVEKSIIQFLGVPYAKPPVGDLRFALPQPPDKWDGVLDTLEYGLACPSPAIPEEMDFSLPSSTAAQGENCLSLNIFYPGSFDNRMNKNKAVMVFIHGGGFTIGAGLDYEPQLLSNREDVIIVTINYRLGLLGFASTADGQIHGNLGLYDQKQALEWIRDNIAHFGGDNNRITIFGESAGAMSVHYLLVSPLTTGLFQGAIIQSNTAFTVPKTFIDQQTQRVAKKYLGCEQTDLSELIACMRQAPFEKFASQAMLFSGEEIFLTGQIDGEFLPESPEEMIEEGKFHKSVNVIIGWNGDDGDVLLKFFARNMKEWFANGVTHEEAVSQLRDNLIPHFYFPGATRDSLKGEIIYDIIYREYLRGRTCPFELTRAILDMANHQSFASSSLLIANAIDNNGGTVYFYRFDYRDKGVSLYSDVDERVGLLAAHGEDLLYVFGMMDVEFGNATLTLTPRGEIISKSIMHAWGQFAKNGKPKFLDETLKSHKWSPYTKEAKKYLVFNACLTEKSLQPLSEELESKLLLWKTTLMKIYMMQESCQTESPQGGADNEPREEL